MNGEKDTHIEGDSRIFFSCSLRELYASSPKERSPKSRIAEKCAESVITESADRRNKDGRHKYHRHALHRKFYCRKLDHRNIHGRRDTLPKKHDRISAKRIQTECQRFFLFFHHFLRLLPR